MEWIMPESEHSVLEVQRTFFDPTRWDVFFAIYLSCWLPIYVSLCAALVLEDVVGFGVQKVGLCKDESGKGAEAGEKGEEGEGLVTDG